MMRLWASEERAQVQQDGLNAKVVCRGCNDHLGHTTLQPHEEGESGTVDMCLRILLLRGICN